MGRCPLSCQVLKTVGLRQKSSKLDFRFSDTTIPGGYGGLGSAKATATDCWTVVYSFAFNLNRLSLTEIKDMGAIGDKL